MNDLDVVKDMIDGLEYHYNNYLEIETVVDLENFWGDEIKKLSHEATAFFNRMGQFYYFVKSKRIQAVFGQNPPK